MGETSHGEAVGGTSITGTSWEFLGELSIHPERVQNHGVSNPVCGIGLLEAMIPGCTNKRGFQILLGDFLPCIISTYLYSQKKFVENCENLHYKLSSTELVPCIQGLIQDSAYQFTFVGIFTSAFSSIRICSDVRSDHQPNKEGIPKLNNFYSRPLDLQRYVLILIHPNFNHFSNTPNKKNIEISQSMVSYRVFLSE